MKIGILQTGLAPAELVKTSGEYPKMFEQFLGPYGFAFETWSVVQGAFPDGPDDADGWLVTGSRHGVYEDHAWIAPLEELIRAVVGADKPLVGVCFGHQIIAQALGGRVEKFDGGWVIGPQTYTFPEGQKTIQAWHQDQIIDLPKGARVVASSDTCENAALLYPGKAYTVQPHPEFDDRFIQGLIEKRGPGVVPEAQLSEAAQRTGMPLDRSDLADQFARFFRERSIA